MSETKVAMTTLLRPVRADEIKRIAKDRDLSWSSVMRELINDGLASRSSTPVKAVAEELFSPQFVDMAGALAAGSEKMEKILQWRLDDGPQFEMCKPEDDLFEDIFGIVKEAKGKNP